MVHWDFERYASVILYINAYYERYMASRKKDGLLDLGDDVKLGIPVTSALLTELDIEETLAEFCNEAQIMTDEMNSDDENLLIDIEHDGDEVILHIDPFILSIFADTEPERVEEELKDIEN